MLRSSNQSGFPLRSSPMDTITLRAAATAVMASFLFAAMGATIKVASHQLDNEMLVFLRNLIGLLLILPLIWRMGLARIRTHRPGMHLLRSLTGLSAMYCFFYALAHLNLAEAMLLNYSAPLFIAVIAVLWLGEQITLTLFIALLCGFAGIALILKPDTGIIAPAALVGSLAGLFAGIAMVSIRRMSDSEPPLRIVFWFSLITTLVSAIPLLWHWQPPTTDTIAIMLLAGVFATGGQILLTRSYTLAPASRVGPYIYTSVLFAALMGWLFWHETLDAWALFGAILVCCSGILAIRRNKPRGSA